ncbi:hypothetical protein NE237_001762 [Protea cynaroides]|uniref:Uncharacterized protein n=1 Tax=Protea cynaroides TaxID=273540 RepID=A0A9Q0KUS0_9MAGN|nr:hypothetical protein NE237_001762 [Protea cynaroides]
MSYISLVQLHWILDNWPSILFAMAGGIVLSLGNLSIQYAWAFVGLSVSSVITASITVVIVRKEQDRMIKYTNTEQIGRFLISIYILVGSKVSKESVQCIGATIEPFGSFVSCLYSKWSDLDISVEVPSGSFVSSLRGKDRSCAF